jgi:predicted Zn-dependent peptidase
MSTTRRGAAALALLLAVTSSAAAQPAAPKPRPRPAKPAKPAKADIAFDEFKLANGLRVIVHTDRKAPIVAVNIWYHVGSKDEALGRSGFAHLFEHLMFQGSENHKHEFFEPFELVGATDQNGTTNSDRTNYFQNVPTTALDMALWMESDRMGHLLGAIDQKVLDEQRGVVQNEKRQGENQPYGQVWERLFASIYPERHPYHHTTIGSMNDLNAAKLDDVKNWFKSWYGPNNAVLVLAGDIDVATAKEKVTKYFGDIAPTATVPKMKPQIAARRTTTREELKDRVPQARIYRVWNIPQFGSVDSDRLELLAHILGGARSSRLERRLVHTDKTMDSVSASAWSSEIGGVFMITGNVKTGVEVATVEKAIDEELKKLLEKGPTAAELKRSQTVLRADFIRGIERIGGFGGKADTLAQCAAFTGKASCFRASLATIASATPASLQAVGRKWLSKGDHVIVVTPGDRTPLVEPPAVADLPPTRVPPAAKGLRTVASDVDRSKGPPVADTFPALKFPPLHRATLSNGLKVILVERPELPLVQMSLQFDQAGFASDPTDKQGLASFAMNMLDEGAGELDALQLGDKLEALGANLQAGASLDNATIYLSSLSENLEPSLAVLSDVLLRAKLDPKEIERVRAQWLAGIEQEKARPDSLARRLLAPVLYGKGHPYAAPPYGTGNETSIAALSRAELASWLKEHLRPDSATLMVVGDTTLAALTPELERAFAAWKAPGGGSISAIPSVKLPRKPRVYLVDQPGAIQATIVVAEVVPSSKDAGAVDFETANAILGGTFTSRLNMNLREDKHWAYGARAGVDNAIGQRTWAASASVQIDKTVESIREMQKEVTKYATGNAPATAAELSKIQSQQVRRLPGSYETGGAVLGTIAEIVRYGRPDDWPVERAKKVQHMTLARTGPAMKTIKPEALTWVIVGDLSKIEKGVRDLKIGDVKVLDADGKVVR